ncbi:50S ribosomal protein L23 [Candidatus Saccharibacteria bacterium]|nr:50S ribosomal protein L23 [Candidatus Saccharibacteria bacterium]
MINLFPRKTEKAYGLSLKNIYVFDVPVSANTKQIVDAIETEYNVKVKSVRTLIQNGKAVRYSRGKRAYPGTTNRQDLKKAYITLVNGNSIKIFDQPEAETKPAKKEKK